MLSDEERKAIANLKTEYEKLIKEDNILFPLYKSEAKRLINLIEKQSKEIEELKIQNNKLAQCHFKYEEMTGVDLLLPDKLEYTNNDKINAKIEEYEKNKKILEEKSQGIFSNLDEMDKVDRNIKFYDAMIKEMQSLLEKE